MACIIATTAAAQLTVLPSPLWDEIAKTPAFSDWDFKLFQNYEYLEDKFDVDLDFLGIVPST